MQKKRTLVAFKQYPRRVAASVLFLFITGCATVDNAPINPIPTSKIAEFATQDPIELLVIGKRAYNSKRFDLAERALLESIKLSPSVIDAHLYLGNLYFLSDRYDLSRDQYAKALRLNKSNLIATNNTMLIDLRQAEKSLGLLENVLQVHSKDYEHVQSLLAAIQVFLKPGQKAVKSVTDDNRATLIEKSALQKSELTRSGNLTAETVSSAAMVDDGISE
ncbi:MAG: tetratricopeptide repeat protein [Arenicella sp.]|nr:tetratricopeptide repeat protein [Arenicella sp.]